jgi:hypothetical protein
MNSSDQHCNLRLNETLFNITCHAQGGLTIPHLIHERKDWYNFTHVCPNIVHLQIGGNDLSDKNTTTLSVANKIFSFAHFLHYGLHINIVVIGELLWRDPMRVHSEYNKKVTDTNSALYNMIQTDGIPQIIFWGHHGFWKDFSHICHDGVHLNDVGTKKYFRSIRNAVLHASIGLGNIYL